jgi:hypothetical protein
VHPQQRLGCGACDWAWTGTDDEADELIRLIAPIAPYTDRIPPQGRCRCGSPIHCPACWQIMAGRIEVPEAVSTDFSEDECRRYHELMTLFRRKDAHEVSRPPRPS